MTRPPRAKGQSLAEYGLVLALVSVVCITGLQALGGTLSGQFTNISGRIGNVSTHSGGSTGSGGGFISPSGNFGSASSSAQMVPGGLPLTTVTHTSPDGSTSVTQVAGSNATVTGGCLGDSCATGIHPITANGIDTSTTLPPTTFSSSSTSSLVP